MLPFSRYHLCGIAGCGMIGIAELLLDLGHQVSGSDERHTHFIDQLIERQLTFCQGSSLELLKSAEVLVYSSAIPADHPERLAAATWQIPCYRRGEFLSLLIGDSPVIAIAGTHGKTTTTGLCTAALKQAAFNVNFTIGGFYLDANCHAAYQHAKHWVVETDESDGSFLAIRPDIAILTNIEPEHMAFYCFSEKMLMDAFQQFADQSRCLIACIDNCRVKQIAANKKNQQVITYGFSAEAHAQIYHYQAQGFGATWQVLYQGNLITLSNAIPGEYNALNTTAAWLAASLWQPSPQLIDGLADFTGIYRRQQIKWSTPTRQKLLIEDYAHHPTEITAVVQAVKAAYPKHNVTLIFQPHRYSRMQTLWPAFIEALTKINSVILLPIDPAGEDPILGFDSEQLLIDCLADSPKQNIQLQNPQQVSTWMQTKSGDHIFLCCGAGTITEMIPTWIEDISN